MKALIGGSLAGSKRVTGLIKLTICMAVIIGLASTGSVSAVPTLLVTLTGDTVAGGSELLTTPLVIPSVGTITFSGTYHTADPGDPEMVAVPVRGATGNTFDIYGSDNPVAEFVFDFDVISLANFVYGGGEGEIDIRAYDIDDNEVAYFYQAWTAGTTGLYAEAGPITLTTNGAAIRRLWWTDTLGPTGFAALDNFDVMIENVIPAPGALMLAGIGVGLVGGLRKRKIA